jgi:hypothetical protein
MAERDPHPSNRSDHLFQDAHGHVWNHSTVSNDTPQQSQPSTSSVSRLTSIPSQPILVPSTPSERQAEDDLFQGIERLIRDFLARPNRRHPYHRIMEWALADDPTLNYCAVVIINPPSTVFDA